MTFNPNTEVALLKAQTKLRAGKRHKPFKLDKHRTQLCKLYDAGATKAELQRWLAMRGIVVQWTTVKRWLDKNA
ncbi:hypothetical protein [Pseudoalteromonas sp. Of11M-6]|uniref:hypothetical protein n=1 Tax=Pseudoalteromonas sp. Of11M-6 TaxID=2917754 RepID=UPI001EF4C2B2|nr:hypothetical protein [Pseudoalteromonas sp. Of11M-6]MCG7552756.1 hypothetical protein [Pseudoalteromonas sp. Of11M-6]